MIFGASKINPELRERFLSAIHDRQAKSRLETAPTVWVLGLALGLLLCGPVLAAEPPAALSLPDLFARLAAQPDLRARFVETKTLAVLDTPLHIEGTVEFRKPAYLAKHVVKPAPEDYIIDGGTVTVSKPTEGQRLELALADYPALEAFAESLRAPLAGDLAALSRHWRPSLGGSRKHWLLALAPIRPELTAVVRVVRLQGQEDRLLRMEIDEANGDTSSLSFEPLP